MTVKAYSRTGGGIKFCKTTPCAVSLGRVSRLPTWSSRVGGIHSMKLGSDFGVRVSETTDELEPKFVQISSFSSGAQVLERCTYPISSSLPELGSKQVTREGRRSGVECCARLCLVYVTCNYLSSCFPSLTAADSALLIVESWLPWSLNSIALAGWPPMPRCI